MEFIDDDEYDDHNGVQDAPPPLSPANQALSLVGMHEYRLGIETKTPMLDTLIYCAFRGWGVRLVPQMPGTLYVENFDLYHHCATLICHKRGPPPRTLVHRAKALKVWFAPVPTAKADLARDFWLHPKDKERTQKLLLKIREIQLLVHTDQ